MHGRDRKSVMHVSAAAVTVHVFPGSVTTTASVRLTCCLQVFGGGIALPLQAVTYRQILRTSRFYVPETLLVLSFVPLALPIIGPPPFAPFGLVR